MRVESDPSAARVVASSGYAGSEMGWSSKMTATSCLRGCDLLLSYVIQSYVSPRLPVTTLPPGVLTVHRDLPVTRCAAVSTTRGATTTPEPRPTALPRAS